MQTRNNSEIEKFAKIAKSFPNPEGKYAMLHKMNKIRCKYIKNCLTEIDGKSILDVGCGGGLLSEKLQEFGAKVTAIDPCAENIEVAQQNLASDVNYIHANIEEFHSEEKFDAICIMEVVEHVDNLSFFIKSCANLLKQEGIIFFSTINRNIKSYILAILAAEYIFKYVPKNTHSWKKFITPAEISKLLNDNNIVVKNLSGMKYSILTGGWSLNKDLKVNYIGYGRKV